MADNTKYIDIKIAFTGHRDLDLSNYCEIRQELKSVLLNIKENEPVPPPGYKNKFIIVFGNAIGADKNAINVCKKSDTYKTYDIN